MVPNGPPMFTRAESVPANVAEKGSPLIDTDPVKDAVPVSRSVLTLAERRSRTDGVESETDAAR